MRKPKSEQHTLQQRIAPRLAVEGRPGADPVGDAALLDDFSVDAVIDLADVAASFGMSKSDLADSLGIGRETLYKRARVEAPKTQARLREMLEILTRISRWAGGKHRAFAWYRAQPIAALGGRTAESLVKSGDAAMLRDYLDHIALGGYA